MDTKESIFNKYLVSIITPTYQSEKYIRNTIDAIINQTYTNWELLITDDNSNDNTVNIINQYIAIDKRIKLFKLKINSGAAIARNNSIKNSNGRFIAFCDSDDIWIHDKLFKQIKFLINNNIIFTFSSYNRILNNKVIGKVTPPSVLTYKKLLKYCPIGTSTVIYDTRFISKQEFPNYRSRQDYALWLIIFKIINQSYSMNEPLVNYNITHNSLSSNKFRAAYNHLYVLRRVANLNYITLFYNFIFYTIRGVYIHFIEKYFYEKESN